MLLSQVVSPSRIDIRLVCCRNAGTRPPRGAVYVLT
jgi:hypothetical protein